MIMIYLKIQIKTQNGSTKYKIKTNYVDYLNQEYGIDEAIAYAYLSAATDFEVSQVVDRTKGIHAKIRKADFKEFSEEQK